MTNGTSGSTDRRKHAETRGRPIDRRAANRRPVVVNARCFGACDYSLDVWLIDISQNGCQLFGRANLLRGGQQVVIHYDGSEAQRGRVIWTVGMKAGIQFDLALPHGKLEQLLTVRAASSIAPVRNVTKLVDQFGRELPPLPSPLKL